MAVKISELVDLIATTINDLPKQYFEVGWDNADYEFCRIYQSEKIEIDGGNKIQRKIMFDPTGNARYRRLYDTDEPMVADVMQTIEITWCQIGTNYSWDKFEILQNRNSAKGFIKLIEVRRLDGLWDLAKLIEEKAWKTPINSSDDLHPYGVPYYLNMHDTSGVINATAGFVGATIVYQDASTGTTCAGLDAGASGEAKWRNYAAVYTKVDNAMLKAFRLAFMKTRFKAPMIVNDPSQKSNAAKRIYASEDMVADLMDLADQRDDRHTGKDVLGNLRVDEGGLVSINRLPVVPIRELEGASYSPLYCVDFRKFQPVIHSGYWMEEGEPMVDRGQHTTLTVFLDGAHNNLCTNRREAGFVMNKVT